MSKPGARSGGSRGKPPLSPEDLRIWRAVAETARPLRGRNTIPEVDQPPPPPPPNFAKSLKTSAAQIPPPPPAKPSLADLEVGQSTGMDKRSAERLKRGGLSIDGRIDLHGLTRDEAKSRLEIFLTNAHRQQRRCLLVITGKGRDGTGVLKAEVPHWLNLPHLRPMVLGVTHAQPKHGGDGALYVLLRRQRQ